MEVSVEENKTRVYNYDNGGNITSVNEYAYTTGTLGSATYTYDAWGNVLSVTDQNGNEVTSAGHLGNFAKFSTEKQCEIQRYILQEEYGQRIK